MLKSVFCIAADYSQAERIVYRLEAEGFIPSEISVVCPASDPVKDVADIQPTVAPEAALAGAAVGVIAGSAFAVFATTTSLMIPGIGLFTVAGPILSIFGSAAIGALTGGIAGGLIGMGITEVIAKTYEAELAAGHFLISVHPDEVGDIVRAKQIFEDAGASNISISSPEEPQTQPAE